MFKITNKEDWKEISINIFGKEIGIYIMDDIIYDEDWEYDETEPKSMVKWWDRTGKYVTKYHHYSLWDE